MASVEMNRDSGGSKMKRFDGEYLGVSPHITILGSSKVGNFVVTIPLLRSLRMEYPDARIDFWGSEVTKDFENAFTSGADPLINWRFSWDSSSTNLLGDMCAALSKRGSPDLLINCDGFNPATQTLSALLRPTYIVGAALSLNLRSRVETGSTPQQRFVDDVDWNSDKFLQRYEGLINDNYLAELLCVMAYLRPSREVLATIPLPWKEPSFDVPRVLIHCTATRSAKLWEALKWYEVIAWCSENNISVGLIGAKPETQRKEYNSIGIEDEILSLSCRSDNACIVDLRGKTSLIELAGACMKADAIISVDSGPLHIAAAMNKNVFAIVGNDSSGVGASPIRLWLPRAPGLRRTISSESCLVCQENRYKNDKCLASEHFCMNGIGSEQVIEWLSLVLEKDA